ncbi:MAG: acetyl ornithine aminotransferase family protein [Acidobacteria bacterium]|nr:acetyl ornithine aminotransferase family protein [Acidobacteriota bacterium]
MSTQLPSLRTSLPGPIASAIIARDQAVISPSYTRDYPLVAARGEGATITDVDGNRFLDMNAGIAVAATGHCHPRVVEAIRGQAETLIHMSGTDFYYENMVALAEKLAALAPGGGPRRVFFGNSGAEAIEAAMKLAKYHTGGDKFIAFFNSFHGRTQGALSLTSSKAVQRRGFGPLMPGVTHIPYANCLDCAYGKQRETCGVECVRVIEDRLIQTILPADEVAAIVVEPVQGEGGYVIPPKKFFDALTAVARAHGMLLIADEVQSGMGRTGRMFASEHFGFEPDILAIAKGIASGLPLGAIVARAEVMNWPPGAHASTFGGNPVAIQSALTTIALLEESLLANATEVGRHMLDRMSGWPARFASVRDVRGLGLMIGVELTTAEQRNRLVQEMFRRGVLILGCGARTIRLCPPLVLTAEQADFAIDAMAELLA